MRGLVWFGLLLALVAVSGKGASGQGTPIPAATAAALISLGSRAGVIFSGRVVEVDRDVDAGFVDVVFHVDHAARGCTDSSTYVLREWAGLWIGEPERYRAGQQLLMVLAARGASGMSAPVGGLEGMIPVVAGRQPPLIHGKTPAPRDDRSEAETEGTVDLRWVQALGVRRMMTKKFVGSEPEWSIGRWPGPVAPLPIVPKSPVPGPSLTTVLALLGQGSGR